jgi:CHAT domain-containing protein
MIRISPFLICIFSLISNSISCQTVEAYNLFLKFSGFYNSGDFLNAEKSMLSVLNTNPVTSEEYTLAAYNNLGVVNIRLGKFDAALNCYNIAEKQVANRPLNSSTLADIYINKARIYTFKKSYNTALAYLEKGIKIYLNIKKPDISVFKRISTSYLNIGIIYYSIAEYETALDYFIKSSELKENMNLPEAALPLLNIAKTYSALNLNSEAERFYLKSISAFNEEYGKDYYKMAELYFDYGLFLQSMKRSSEALSVYKNALSICLKSYGVKHTLVSLAYKHLGDYYLDQNTVDSALYFLQRSIIAVVCNFNDQDINANPSLDSVIFDIRLLDNLKSKANALELFGDQQIEQDKKLIILKKSLETVEIAMELISRIRNNYITEESREYLAENEKETYIFAVNLANQIYSITGDNQLALKMYDIAKKSKAAILLNKMSENEMILTSGIPDSLQIKLNILSGNIAAYKNLIKEEMRKKGPDNNKISLWKDALFEMNRDKEEAENLIDFEFPQYHKLIQKAEPITLNAIQKQLTKDETVIDYLLSNKYYDGKRKLYSFIITHRNLKFREMDLDSQFVKNVNVIRNNLTGSASYEETTHTFNSYTTSLFYMYNSLIKPVEELIDGNRLIIIPDEEIGLLPFDAFLKSKPTFGQTDYERLEYLINDYSFSYGYSSSLIFGNENDSRSDGKVIAFSPDYDKSGAVRIPGAAFETNAIFKLFSGQKFHGDKATETNFREAIQSPSIIHLAMHSATDSINSTFSYMQFNQERDTINDGKLFNYEVSLSRVNSAMVVLSACNSGTGTLYHGEGLMSLARGFIMAGASSVIKTAWEINDETSAVIIIRFYYFLSKGKTKDEALRLAKLEYLKGNPPIYRNPYYWAAYEVLGDNSGILKNTHKLPILITSLSGLLVLVLMIVYFKRRRIFFARL